MAAAGAAVFLVAAAVAGCGRTASGPDTSSARGQAQPGVAQGGGSVPNADSTGSGAQGSAALAPGQSLIVTTGLDVSTPNPAQAAVNAQQIAAQAGGYVAQESVGTGPQSLANGDPTYGGDGTDNGAATDGDGSGSATNGGTDGVIVGDLPGPVVLPQPSNADNDGTQALLVLRVPPRQVTAVMHALAGPGKVVYQTSSSTDVTEQVADVNSRVASQESSIAALRSLMNRAGSLGDVVSLEQAIDDRESDLEALEAQQRALADEVQLATITVGYYTPLSGVRAAPAPHRAAFVRGLSNGWRAVAVFGRALLVIVGWLAPFAVIAAVLWWPVRRVVRASRELRGRRMVPVVAGVGGGGGTAGAKSVSAESRTPSVGEARNSSRTGGENERAAGSGESGSGTRESGRSGDAGSGEGESEA